MEYNMQNFRDLLTIEVKFVISIIIFTAGVIAPFYSVKQDVELIKQNHYFHIENLTKEMKEMKERQTVADEKFIKLMETIAELKYQI